LLELSDDLRELGGRLPHHLGLTRDPSGGWEDFVQLEPNRDLPIYAAEPTASWGDRLLPQTTLELFREAHYWAGIFGLLADRIADRQVVPDDRLRRLRRLFLRNWERRLSEATGDSAFARRAIADAVAAWRSGVAMERRAFARGTLETAEYANISRRKLRWIATTSRCLLITAGAPERAQLFQDVYDCFLFGLQCRDDALDVEEDAAIRGAGLPMLLGYPAGGMVRAAPKIVRRAVELASHGEFHRLSEWMSRWVSDVDRHIPAGIPVQNEIAGMIIAASWDEQPSIRQGIPVRESQAISPD
ncbi:MAG: hypothetical protein ABI134_06065, partial [Byssovorax sp.]